MTTPAPSLPPGIPRPPNKPADYECCGRHCCPCIFDYYWDAIGRWEDAVRELGHDPAALLASIGRTR